MPEPRSPTEWKIALNSFTMCMGHVIKTFMSGKDSVLCYNHFQCRPARKEKKDSSKGVFL